MAFSLRKLLDCDKKTYVKRDCMDLDQYLVGLRLRNGKRAQRDVVDSSRLCRGSVDGEKATNIYRRTQTDVPARDSIGEPVRGSEPCR